MTVTLMSSHLRTTTCMHFDTSLLWDKSEGHITRIKDVTNDFLCDGTLSAEMADTSGEDCFFVKHGHIDTAKAINKHLNIIRKHMKK